MGKNSFSKETRYKEEPSGNIRTIKCSNGNEKFSGWTQEQNEEDRGKNISELKDRTIEITQYEQHRENRLEKKKKKNGASGTCETITKDLRFLSLESQKERRKKAGLKEYTKE